MIALESELREKDDYSIRDWIIPGLVSLGVHAFVGGLIDYSFQKGEFEVQPRMTLDKKVREIVDESACKINPISGVYTDEEKIFVNGLVEDLQDQKLDSMSFGEWMVRAETFVHNGDVYCEKDQWNVEEELRKFNQRKDFVLEEYNPGNDLLFAADVFDYLHDGVSSERYNQLRGNVDDDLLGSVLVRYEESQARALDALRSGYYNCESGTLWFTALTDVLDEKVGVYAYDDHVLSYVESNEEILVDNWLGARIVSDGYFENTSVNGVFIEPITEGVHRPKEAFVVNYLVARDELMNLPGKFRDWYKIKKADGLVNYWTNSFGKWASVGKRTGTLEDELRDAPTGFDLSSRKSGLAVVLFNEQKYDWEKIYAETRERLVGLGIEVESYEFNQIMALLDMNCFAVEHLARNFEYPEEALARCDESYKFLLDEQFYALKELSNGSFDLDSDGMFDVTLRLGAFLRRQNMRVVNSIVNDEDYAGLEEKFVAQDLELLNSAREDRFQRLNFFSLAYDFLRVKSNWEVENNEEYRNALMDVGFRQLDLKYERSINEMLDEGRIVDFLIAMGLKERDYGDINKVLRKVVESPSVAKDRSVMLLSFEYPELFKFPDVVEIFDRGFMDDAGCSGKECNFSDTWPRLCSGNYERYYEDIGMENICKWCGFCE